MGTGMTQAQGRPPVRAAGFTGVAYAFAVAMLGTTLPTPLYVLYERKFGFGSLGTTVIYAVYAGGVLATLLLAGRLSDRIGRRRMLLAGLAASAASAVVFAVDGSVAALFAGRALSGLSAGAFTATATVALVELAPAARRATATLVATGVNMGGLGCGPLLAGLLAQVAPRPLLLPFLADLVLVAAAVVAVWRAPETLREPHGGWSPRAPRVPSGVRRVFVPAATVGFAGFAVLGLFTAIAPAFLATVLGEGGHLLPGAVVASVFAASTLGQLALARVPGRAALPGGCLALVAGLAGVAGGLLAESLPLLVAGAVVAGAGQGLSLRAGVTGLTAASARVAPEAGAEVVAAYFTVAYIGISLPVVCVGVAADAYGLRTAGVVFVLVVAGLVLAALAVTLRHRRGGGNGVDGAGRPAPGRG